MSNLRNKIIRLAYEKPEYRDQLLPLLKEAGWHDDLGATCDGCMKTRTQRPPLKWLDNKGHVYCADYGCHPLGGLYGIQYAEFTEEELKRMPPKELKQRLKKVRYHRYRELKPSEVVEIEKGGKLRFAGTKTAGGEKPDCKDQLLPLVKEAGKWKNKTAILESQGKVLLITFMAGTGERFADKDSMKYLLDAFDKEVYKSQSSPLSSGDSWSTVSQGVLGGFDKSVSIYITRAFEWSQLNSSHEYNLTTYDDIPWSQVEFTKDDVIKEIMEDVLSNRGWKPMKGRALV